MSAKTYFTNNKNTASNFVDRVGRALKRWMSRVVPSIDVFFNRWRRVTVILRHLLLPSQPSTPKNKLTSTPSTRSLLLSTQNSLLLHEPREAENEKDNVASVGTDDNDTQPNIDDDSGNERDHMSSEENIEEREDLSAEIAATLSTEIMDQLESLSHDSEGQIMLLGYAVIKITLLF